MQPRYVGVGKTGGGAIFVVVWEVREITSTERENDAGKERERASLCGHPCQPGDGHFAKNFRFVCTRRSKRGDERRLILARMYGTPRFRRSIHLSIYRFDDHPVSYSICTCLLTYLPALGIVLRKVRCLDRFGFLRSIHDRYPNSELSDRIETSTVGYSR